MADFRIPGPQCSTRSDFIDDGTLCLWFTPPPPPVCRVDGAASWMQPSPRRWHAVTRIGGFPGSSLTVGPEGLALLKAIEELHLKPYDDQTGNDITSWVKGATIGYGHLIGSDEWDSYEGGISEEGADTLFLADLSPAINAVGSVIKVGLQQYEFDALVILTFNIGISGFKGSSVVKLINDPAATTGFTDLEAAWKAWNKSQGKVNKGLQNRRDAEWKIYTQGLYERW